MAGLATHAAEAVVAAPFDVTFDHVTSFAGGQRPLVLCGGDGLRALVAFRSTLDGALQKVGLGAATGAYTPHVALLHDERDVGRHAVGPIRWTVTAFLLLQGLRGRSQHVLLDRWPLRG